MGSLVRVLHSCAGLLLKTKALLKLYYMVYGASGFGESYGMKKEGGEDQNPQTAASLSVTFASVSPTSTPSVSSVDSPLSLFSRFCFEAFVATRWIRSAI